jgi:glycosyltransferase involved in cell wall biosynthesis
MYVALIAPPWLPVPPPRYGGTEAVIDRLARGLIGFGHEVLLCTTGDSTAGVRRHALYDEARTEAIGMIVPELCHVIDAREAAATADVIHDHTITGGLLAGTEDGPPTAVTHHGPFDASFARIFSAVAARAAVVAISAAQAGGAEPGTIARIIHHGVETERIPVGQGQGGYLAFLGRITPAKGIAEAIAMARAVGRPLRIGAKCREPEERAYFDAVVRPQLGPDIEYLGELDETEKYDLLGNAAGLLNPIQWDEPFGLVMIESLATGTPVLTLARGAAPEIVDDGVTGVLATDCDGLLARLAAVEGLDRTACRVAAETRFSSARMVAEHLALYEDLLGRAAALRPRLAVATG